MTKLLLTAIFISSACLVNAQYKTIVPDINNPFSRQSYQQKKYPVLPGSSAILKLSDRPRQYPFEKTLFPPSQINIDNMPVAVPGNIILSYLQHNEGFTVFKASTDNMFIVKPDDNFTSAMPVLK